MWPAWQLLAPHSAVVFDDLAAEPDSSDNAVEAAAYAAYMAARYQASQGFHAAAEAEYRDVLAAELRVLGPDHPRWPPGTASRWRWLRGAITPPPRPSTATCWPPSCGCSARTTRPRYALLSGSTILHHEMLDQFSNRRPISRA